MRKIRSVVAKSALERSPAGPSSVSSGIDLGHCQVRRRSSGSGRTSSYASRSYFGRPTRTAGVGSIASELEARACVAVTRGSSRTSLCGCGGHTVKVAVAVAVID